MPELTPQDRKRYRKLYNAAATLNNTIPDGDKGPKINPSFTLKELTSAFFHKLTQPDAPSFSFEQLQAQVELTGGYLEVYRLFTEAIDSITDAAKKSEINKDYQDLLMQYNQIKASVKVANDDILEDVTIPYSDPLFLSLLTAGNVKQWTTQLIANQTPPLRDDDVQVLINAWRQAVTEFVEDARKKNEDNGQLTPGRTETIAHFFSIHEQLEGLYSELSRAVASNS